MADNTEAALAKQKQQVQSLRDQLASKQGEAKKLQQDYEQSLAKLKELGVDTPEQAQAKIDELQSHIETQQQQAAALIQQAQDILDGKPSSVESAIAEQVNALDGDDDL